ncbi:MAG: YciI family protein [Methylocystaceae bacterium]|nr:YciI family protein [Methylocystaceae bacterium]
MLFVAMCIDKLAHVDLRMSTRPAHLAFLKAFEDQVKLGGPLLDADGQVPIGSLLIIESEDEASAHALLAQDPYAQAGLFERVEVFPWKHVVGADL